MRRENEIQLPPLLTLEDIALGSIQDIKLYEISGGYKYVCNYVIEETRYRISFFNEEELSEEDLKSRLLRELLQKRKLIIRDIETEVTVINITSLNGQSLDNIE